MKRLLPPLLCAAVFLLLAAAGSSADSTLELRVVSETSSTITLGWDPQPGYGYLFSVDGTLVSRTYDPSRSTVRFAKGASSYEVAVIVKGSTGTYPPATPPPPKAACENGLDDDGDGKIDLADPGCSGSTDNDETDPPPTSANWYLSPSGSDANPCTQAAPCASLQRGYTVASAGDVVRAAAGVYPSQTLSYVSAKENYSTRVVFELSGVSVPGVTSLGAQHVELRGLTMTGISLILRPSTGSSWDATSKPSKDWVVQGGSLKLFLIRNVTNVTIRNVSIGGYDMNTGWDVPKIGAYQPSGTAAKPSQGVVLEGNSFHDITRSSTSSSHAECLYLDNGIDGLVIARNVFTNCGVMDIHGDIGLSPVSNVLVENNFFDVARDTQGNPVGGTINMKGSAGYVNVTFRFNTLVGNLRSESGTVWSNPNVYGNVFVSHSDCAQAIPSSAYGKNMMNAVGCGSQDVVADPQLVSFSTAQCSLGACYRNDLHLGPASPAIDAATSAFPIVDVDGDSRPNGAAADLGADER